MIYRQGDVLLVMIDSLPKDAEIVKNKDIEKKSDILSLHVRNTLSFPILHKIDKQQWANECMKSFGLVEDECKTEKDACLICAVNKKNGIILGCHCKDINMCVECLYMQTYESTFINGKTHSQCPYCTFEYTIHDVKPSKELYFKSVIEKCSVGAQPVIREQCITCNKKADARDYCCETTGKIYYCAECLINTSYDNIMKGRVKCPHCNRDEELVIYRDICWKSQKRQKN